jgi:hypothetical protein
LFDLIVGACDKHIPMLLAVFSGRSRCAKRGMTGWLGVLVTRNSRP